MIDEDTPHIEIETLATTKYDSFERLLDRIEIEKRPHVITRHGRRIGLAIVPLAQLHLVVSAKPPSVIKTSFGFRGALVHLPDEAVTA